MRKTFFPVCFLFFAACVSNQEQAAVITDSPITVVDGSVSIAGDANEYRYTAKIFDDLETTWSDYAYFTLNGVELSKTAGSAGSFSADIAPNGSRISMVIFGRQSDTYSTFDDRFWGIAAYLNAASKAYTIATMTPGFNQRSVGYSPIENLDGTFNFTINYEVQKNGSCDVEFILSKGGNVLRTLAINISTVLFYDMGTHAAIRVTSIPNETGVVISNVRYSPMVFNRRLF